MKKNRPELYRTLLACLLLMGADLKAHAVDADITASVGRLLVPSVRYENGHARHFEERCSATLITDAQKGSTSRLVLSAWHCIEYHRDLTRPPVFQPASGKRYRARVLASGGSMRSDWVLLQLETPLPGAARLASVEAATAEQLLMAGYPRGQTPDTAPATHAAPDPDATPRSSRGLQVTRRCRVIGTLGDDPTSDCVLHKGASGGGVFAADASSRYLGVISQGDQQTQSTFVPLQRFRRRIIPYLRQPSRD